LKLGVQENRLPGDSLADRVALAEDLGFDGIELWGHDIAERLQEIKNAFKGRSVRPCTICSGHPGALIHADPQMRRAACEGILERLRIAGDLGMVGVIVVPGFIRDRTIPDLSPYKTAKELETELLVAQLQEMAPQAEKTGAVILLEALNRYETHFLNRQVEAAEIAKRVGSPAVRIMCDLFHMNIEEPNTPETLRKVGPLCRHVHLADNTRTEPGSGSIDFRAAFQALKEIGFDGYMALECRLSDPDDPAGCLKRCVEYLRSAMK